MTASTTITTFAAVMLVLLIGLGIIFACEFVGQKWIALHRSPRNFIMIHDTRFHGTKRSTV